MRNLSLRRLLMSATIASTCLLAAAEAPAAPTSENPAVGVVMPSESMHDPRLDLASAQIKTAINLLHAAQNPNAKHPDRPFNGHDDRAIRFLEFAQMQIEDAIAYADASN